MTIKQGNKRIKATLDVNRQNKLKELQKLYNVNISQIINNMIDTQYELAKIGKVKKMSDK